MTRSIFKKNNEEKTALRWWIVIAATGLVGWLVFGTF